MNVSELPLTLDIATAARLIGIGRNSAYAAVARGELPVVIIGRRLLIPTHLLLKMLGYTDPVIADAGEGDQGRGTP